MTSMKAWVADALDKTNPWGWYRTWVAAFVRWFSGEEDQGLPCDLPWVEKIPDDEKATYPRPVLLSMHAAIQLHRFVAAHVGTREQTPPVDLKVARSALAAVFNYHLEKKGAVPLEDVVFCDPLCEIGSMLAIPYLAGCKIMGFDGFVELATAAREVLRDGHFYPGANLDAVEFEAKEAKGLHYIVTKMPSQPEWALQVFDWIQGTAERMVQDRSALGLAPWPVVVYKPRAVSVHHAFSVEKRVPLPCAEVPDGEALFLALK